MKTTVEVSDDLYRRAKAEAALRGRKLKDLVEEGLRLVLETPRKSHRRRRLAALMKGARGAVDSGVPDLASNPEYLTGFGHDARRHRWYEPLVAFLDRAEQHHRWVAERIEELDTPLLVCEPVLAEAMHLLARFSRAHDALFGLLENGALMIAFHIDEHISALRKLHQKYRDRPMSLADACIERMAEIYERHVVLTLDSDFSVYRKHGRVPLRDHHYEGRLPCVFL